MWGLVSKLLAWVFSWQLQIYRLHFWYPNLWIKKVCANDDLTFVFPKAARKVLTDDDVRAFMKPRPLQWNKPLNIKIDPKLGPLAPESMAKLNEALKEDSYLQGPSLYSIFT